MVWKRSGEFPEIFSSDRLAVLTELQRLEHLTKLNINYCRDVDHVGIVTTPRRLREFHAARIGYVPQKVWAQVFSSSGLYPSLIETLSLSFYPSETIVLKVLPKNLRELGTSAQKLEAELLLGLTIRPPPFFFLVFPSESFRYSLFACSRRGIFVFAESTWTTENRHRRVLVGWLSCSCRQLSNIARAGDCCSHWTHPRAVATV